MSGRLVVLSPNWLGDAVMALPAIAAIRAARPAGSVDVAARRSVAPLFSMVPGVGVVALERGREAASLAGGGYGSAILLPNSFGAAYTARRAGIAERWGYATSFRSWLLTRAVVPPERVHQVDYYRLLATSLGFVPRAREPRLEIDAVLRTAGADHLAAHGWDRRSPLVALAPGAAFGTAKRWPAASFGQIADRIAASGARAVLVGVAADRPAVTEVLARARSAGHLDLAGATDLRMLAAVLANTRGLVTNDSGAMHLAAALGVPVTAIFGPTRERETHPVGAARQATIVSSVWCRPCMLRDCPLTHRCMTTIAPNRVWAETAPLLS